MDERPGEIFVTSDPDTNLAESIVGLVTVGYQHTSLRFSNVWLAGPGVAAAVAAAQSVLEYREGLCINRWMAHRHWMIVPCIIALA